MQKYAKLKPPSATLYIISCSGLINIAGLENISAFVAVSLYCSVSMGLWVCVNSFRLEPSAKHFKHAYTNTHTHTHGRMLYKQIHLSVHGTRGAFLKIIHLPRQDQLIVWRVE